MSDDVAVRYMTRFQCVGAACEDTCCDVGSWSIPIARADHERVARALDKSDQDRAALARLFAPAPERVGAFAVIRPRDDGRCTMLDGDGWCALHRRFGDDALPQVCSSYPRAVSRIGERHELTGKLSCPEVARLCLLADDAVEPVPAAREAMGRGPLALAVDEPADAYVGWFPEVRRALVALSAAPAPATASRQLVIAWLGQRTAPFYHRGCAPFERERIAAELREVERADVQAAFDAKLAATPAQDALPLALVVGLARARLQAPVAPAFRRVVEAVARRYAGDADARDPVAALTAMGAALAPAHAERRARAHADSEFAARAERWFGNYCKDYWVHDWFIQSPTILEHALVLGVRVALVRFLLLGHPALDAALALKGAAERRAAYDRLAVEVFYAVTRAFDHNSSVRAQLARVVSDRGLVTVAHAAAFFKL
jgi:lysine-N-methylase